MYEIKNAQIPSWYVVGQTSFPKSIDINCPHCLRIVTFSVPHQNMWHNAGFNCFTQQLSCPRCRKTVRFILIDHVGKQSSLSQNATLWMFPSPNQKQPLDGIKEIDGFNDPLLRAYESLINVFNSGEWSATAVLARRLLEGITLHILGESCKNEPLARRLSKLPESTDLAKPILSLSDAIRKGGNLGAHFDLEKEPDSTVARLMVDLIEDLIEYLFILPKRIDALHNRIENLSNEE
ncbi:MAG: hypothetical protein DRQ02_12530 [Candidatus Latescibacterota bacterium]|nr:MAG: hypothetical protein DRQ02_12530 [Candidatus Latescibacterota bacterium]